MRCYHKQTKVYLGDEKLSIKQASWLGFLRCACKKTLQGLAKKYGTQRSNISAFVTSGGKTRNISQDKVASILFDLGVLADGTLLPGVHCWQVEEEIIPDMCDLLVANEFEWAQVIALPGYRSSTKAFVMVKISSTTLVLANFESNLTEKIQLHFRDINREIEMLFLDRPAWAIVYAFWMKQKDLLLQATSCNELKHLFANSLIRRQKSCWYNNGETSISA